MSSPRVTICLPHWEVERYARICLRSIRKCSRKYDLEVIVVDNGSRDASLDYLRGLDWIRLIERPDESRENWPLNFFTGLDRGLEAATGEFFLTMHTDVFVRSENWLDPFLREFANNPRVAMAGAWKLELAHPLYLWQKRVFGYLNYRTKRLLGGRKRHITWKQDEYPRDYCAMYRRSAVQAHGLTFTPVNGSTGGGRSIAMQLQNAGFTAGMFPVHEMGRHILHVAHGTSAVRPDHPLRHARAQRKAEQRVAKVFEQPWVAALERDASLDRRSTEAHPVVPAPKFLKKQLASKHSA